MNRNEFLTPQLYRSCLKGIAEAEQFSVEVILTFTVNLPDFTDKISFLQKLSNDFTNGTLPALMKRHLETEYIGNLPLLKVNTGSGSVEEQLESQLNDLKTFFRTFAPVFVAEYRQFVEFQRLEEMAL